VCRNRLTGRPLPADLGSAGTIVHSLRLLSQPICGRQSKWYEMAWNVNRASGSRRHPPNTAIMPGGMTHPATDTGVGRTFNTSTNLGRLIALKGVRAYEVSAACRIAPRTLTELLAGRRKPNQSQVIALCEYLNCDPEHLT
jgi:DNA-binding Xre family transcriptional regulator